MITLKNPKSESTITSAIKFLMDHTDQELILMGNSDYGFYILPAVLTPNDGSYDETEVKLGALYVIQYQVSDGIQNRSFSNDTCSFHEAVKIYKQMIAKAEKKSNQHRTRFRIPA